MSAALSKTAKLLARVAPLAVLAVALFVRLGLMFGKGGGWGYGVDYDEGVYFAAASLVWNGVLPYRDFVFVHPPGLLAWLLLPAGLGKLAIGPAAAFVVARWIAAFAGTASVFLAFRLAEKRGGVVAGLTAGLALALYPEAVVVDRGVFLEPVLNLSCLCLAFCVQRGTLGLAPEKKWIALAGLAAGAAVAVKLWAGLWLLAALVPMLRNGGLAATVRFLAFAVIAASALILPFAATAPQHFLEQILTFHTLRPPDGVELRAERVMQIFSWKHAGSDLLALVGLVAVLARPALRRTSVFFAIVFLGTIAAFLANSSYWDQYNAHLAPSSAVLAGIGAGVIWSAVSKRPLPLRAVTALALASLSIFGIAHVKKGFGHSTGLLELRDALGGTKAEVLCAFEPAWLLIVDRLPPKVGSTGYFVDTYAMGLLEAGRSGKKFPNAQLAFDDSASQAPFAQALERCDLLVMGDRGRNQLAGALEDQVMGSWLRVGQSEIFARPARRP